MTVSPAAAGQWLRVLCVAALLSACGGDDAACDDCAPVGTFGLLELEADLGDPERFFDVPYPSDLRLDDSGRPRLSGFPNPANLSFVQGFLANASEARGFSMLPTALFRFSDALDLRADSDVIAAETSAPILLIDVDPDSPDQGQLIPVVARTPDVDLYVPEGALAVAPRPGFVLRPDNSYAFVVRSALTDAAGKSLAQSPRWQRLSKRAPRGALEQSADTLLAPMWQTLDQLGVARREVVSATVFTTGDVVADMAELSDAMLARYDVTIEGLTVQDDPEIPDVCILAGTVSYPQFQAGTPPYDTAGRFVVGSDGLPIEQRSETAPIKLVLPKTEMPAAGYPLVLNIHGSGGYSIAMLRPVNDLGQPGEPIGSGFPLAHRGFAIAGSAMPLNPERLPGASELAYINPMNLACLRDTFRQGVIELRLLLEALLKLNIEPSVVAGCSGPTLPSGATGFAFDPEKVVVTGQSMGGMLTNMLAPVEPKLGAVVPTGAGGHWSHFIFETPLNGGAYPGLVNLAAGTPGSLSLTHPLVGVAAAGLEPADPIVYAPRIGRRPLPGVSARSILEPSAPQDSYFATATYDAMALAFGHPQAGPAQWPSLQESLALAGLDGELSLPLQDNLSSESGEKYTGAILPFAPIGDGHAIYVYRDDLKYQYGCFLWSWASTGKARIPAAKDDWKAVCE